MIDRLSLDLNPSFLTCIEDFDKNSTSESCGFQFHYDFDVVGDSSSITDFDLERELIPHIFSEDMQGFRDCIYRNFLQFRSKDMASLLESDWNKSSESSDSIDSHFLENALNKILSISSEENFEDGFKNSLTRGIDSLLCDFNEILIVKISDMINKGKFSEDQTAEILKYFGKLKHDISYKARFDLLIKCLSNQSLFIVDAAGVGLAEMDDIDAIQPVRNAILRISDNRIKENMELVLDQLEKTSIDLLSSENR